jgi:hypothetical protein
MSEILAVLAAGVLFAVFGLLGRGRRACASCPERSAEAGCRGCPLRRPRREEA